MRDLTDFKRVIGPAADKYTPPQLEQLQQQMYAMADLLLDIYLTRNRKSLDIDASPPQGTMKSERSFEISKS